MLADISVITKQPRRLQILKLKPIVSQRMWRKLNLAGCSVFLCWTFSLLVVHIELSNYWLFFFLSSVTMWECLLSLPWLRWGFLVSSELIARFVLGCLPHVVPVVGLSLILLPFVGVDVAFYHLLVCFFIFQGVWFTFWGGLSKRRASLHEAHRWLDTSVQLGRHFGKCELLGLRMGYNVWAYVTLPVVCSCRFSGCLWLLAASLKWCWYLNRSCGGQQWGIETRTTSDRVEFFFFLTDRRSGFFFRFERLFSLFVLICDSTRPLLPPTIPTTGTKPQTRRHFVFRCKTVELKSPSFARTFSVVVGWSCVAVILLPSVQLTRRASARHFQAWMVSSDSHRSAFLLPISSQVSDLCQRKGQNNQMQQCRPVVSLLIRKSPTVALYQPDPLWIDR